MCRMIRWYARIPAHREGIIHKIGSSVTVLNTPPTRNVRTVALKPVATPKLQAVAFPGEAQNQNRHTPEDSQRPPRQLR